MNIKARFVFLLFVLPFFLLGGCATLPTRGEITPKLSADSGANVALAVIEARPYVLSGEKPPKFEGIFRGGFGIPLTVLRPKRPEEERFVDLLSGMIKDGLTDAGARVAVVRMPLGASMDDTWKKMVETGAERYIVMRVHESNWDAGGFNFSYKYDFGVIVAGKGATVRGTKNFTGQQANKPSEKFNVFDMHSVVYRELIELMFADPTIRTALQN